MAIYLGQDKVSLAGTNGGFMLNGRLIATKEYELKLSDTNYSSLTISTTAQTLTLPATTYTANPSTSIICFRLGSNYDGTSIDLNNRDYVVFFESVTTYAYSSAVSGTIHGIKSAYARDSHRGRYQSSIVAATGQLDTSSTISGYTTYTTSKSRFLYQKADNTYAVQDSSYGIYTTSSDFASFNTNGYLDLRLTTVQAKSNDSYFPTAAMNSLDQANTKIKSTWYVYEGDKSIVGQIYTRAYELATV